MKLMLGSKYGLEIWCLKLRTHTSIALRLMQTYSTPVDCQCLVRGRRRPVRIPDRQLNLLRYHTMTHSTQQLGSSVTVGIGRGG